MEQGVRHHGCLGPQPPALPAPGTLEQQGPEGFLRPDATPWSPFWAKPAAISYLYALLPDAERGPREKGEVGRTWAHEWEGGRQRRQPYRLFPDDGLGLGCGLHWGDITSWTAAEPGSVFSSFHPPLIS